MNKKLVILGISAVLMLVTITFASALNITTNIEKKESPLYKIRIKLAIGEKISQIFNNIKTKFFGERIFWIPIKLIKLSESEPRGICSPSVSTDTCKANYCTIDDYNCPTGWFCKPYSYLAHLFK